LGIAVFILPFLATAISCCRTLAKLI
jgi:hypothetical protein